MGLSGHNPIVNRGIPALNNPSLPAGCNSILKIEYYNLSFLLFNTWFFSFHSYPFDKYQLTAFLCSGPVNIMYYLCRNLHEQREAFLNV